MQLLLWAILSSAHALFFNLGGGGGGCSCPSSCAAPPPDNFGCRLMCAGQQMSCQQQAFNQQFAQQPLAQPNFGIPAPAVPQPLPAAATYNNYPAPAYNYQQQQQYARPLPQYTAFGQQPRVVQPQLVAPAATPQYLPPAPTRQDTYVNSLNRITNYGPQAPVAPPVYGQQQTTSIISHQPTNPLPASFVSVPQTGPIGSPSVATEEVNLLPPEQPGTEQTQVQSVVEQAQGTNYVTDRPQSNYGKSAGNDFSISISESEKKTPEEIAQSIEDSYDEQGDLMEISTSAVQIDEEKEILTNQVTVLPNYVTTEGAPLDFEGITEIVETNTARTEVMEYALGNNAPVRAEVPQAAVSPASSYKTLTRAEGLSSTYTHQENFSQSETTETVLEPDAVTEDYAPEETETDNGSPGPEPEDNGEISASGYNKKYRQPLENYFDTTIATTTEIQPAKRSESADQRAFKCNSAKLKNIMDEKMTVSAPVSKQLIYAEATAQFPGLSLDVICSRHSFSYIVVTSPIYCEHRKSPLTCFAFFQP